MRQVKLGNKWTFDNYGLWLAPSPEIGEAEPKTNYIDIPYGNGSIDLTEALTGEVSYGDRKLNFSLVFPANKAQWNAIHKQLIADVHGRRLSVVMPQYPDYVFNGRVAVGKLDEDNSIATVAIAVTADPYMLKNQVTNFNGTIPEAGNLAIKLSNDRMATLPEFTTSAEVKIDFNGGSYTHSAGTFTLANIMLAQGENALTVTGAAGTTVKIEYQEGTL